MKKYFSRKGNNSVVKSKEVSVKRNDGIYFFEFKFMEIMNECVVDFIDSKKNKRFETWNINVEWRFMIGKTLLISIVNINKEKKAKKLISWVCMNQNCDQIIKPS